MRRNAHFRRSLKWNWLIFDHCSHETKIVHLNDVSNAAQSPLISNKGYNASNLDIGATNNDLFRFHGILYIISILQNIWNLDLLAGQTKVP